MTKIIIQPGKYRGLYQIVLLRCRRFFLIQWWRPVVISEHHEEEAILKLCELIKKYQIKPCAIYDWSGDESYQEAIQKSIKKVVFDPFRTEKTIQLPTILNETAAYSYNENRPVRVKVLRMEK